MSTVNEKSDQADAMTLLKRLARLYMSNLRLGLAEKLTLLLSGIATAVIAFVLGLCGLVFVTLSVSSALSSVLPGYWSHLIIGLFYLALIAVVVIFRTYILVNPIARFVSKIIVEKPQKLPIEDEIKQ